MANTVTPLTPEAQLALRNRAKAELGRLEAVYADKEIEEKISVFKEKFGICEIVYKVVLENHQFNKTGKHLDRLR